MFKFHLAAAPVWAPADEGTEGETSSPASEPSTEGADPGTGSAPQPQKDPGSSILDFAPKGEQVSEEDAWKMPEGMDIPDHLRGSSAEDTLAKLSKAYKGARQELSSRKKGDGVLDGSIPDSIDGYEFTSEDPDSPAFKELTSEESKPIVDAWRKAALDNGIPDAAFNKFMQSGLNNMIENGMQIGGDPEEITRINGEMEMQRLVEEHGQAGANQMLRQVDSWAQKLADRGVLQDMDDVNEFAQMVGTAHGLKLMNRIIVAEFGEKAIPAASPLAGAPTTEEAYAAHREALSMKPGADREEAIARAEQMLNKAIQEGGTTGQVRSRVL